MTVLITGAGLIGTHVARAMLDQGTGVVLYDPDPSPAYIQSVVGPDRKLFRVERGDVRDLPRIMELMLSLGVTRILHTAGFLGPRVEENPSLAFQVNVAGTLNLIEAARIRGLARIVLISSNYVYFDPEPPPGEGPIPEDTPYRVPGTFYGAYKAMAEIMALAYQRLPGVNVVICRPCAVYGRGEFLGGARFGRALNQALLEAIRAAPGTEVPIQIPAAERVYVKDVALPIREAVFVEKPSARVYNVGSGEIVTTERLTDAVNRAIPGIRAVPAGPPAAKVRPLDIALARQDLKYEPRWPLVRAIQDYVDELRAHGPSTREL